MWTEITRSTGATCPRRGVVERSFAWLGRSRRFAKDFEAIAESSAAGLRLANLRLITRRPAKSYPTEIRL